MRACFYLVIAMVSSAGAALAAEVDYERGYRLAAEKGCFECHAMAQTSVGPSFRAIARHYRFNAEQAQHLPAVIRGGSAGHWGDRFVMWAQPRLSDQEVRQLVDWILSQ